MRKSGSTGRRKRKLLRRLLLLALTAAAGAGAWQYMAPLLTSGSVKTYASYTVARGDIAATSSFSATLSVGESETLYNESGAESIRQVFVRGGQEVKAGDELMELSNGTILEAGIDGVVNEIRYEAGDWLRPNAQLVQVCDLTNLQVSLQVDEYDVENVSVGQKCTITIVPLGLEFETELTHVSRLSSAAGSVAYYTAKAELTVPEEVLPGMTASVTIPADAVEDVLTLDMAALSFDEADKPCVLLKEGEEYVQHSIETGLSDGMKIEILSGLSEGDEVWVVFGTEEVEASFSLADVYKKIFGEKIAINESAEGGTGRSRGGFPGGMDAESIAEMFGEGMSFPGSMDQTPATATDMQLPEGIPKGMKIPEGFPERMEMPEGLPEDMSVEDMAAMFSGGFPGRNGAESSEGFPGGMGSGEAPATATDTRTPGRQGGSGQSEFGQERQRPQNGERSTPDEANEQGRTQE